ncbi:MAG: sulfotransferase [Syntrophotaleaceae bacterium]
MKSTPKKPNFFIVGAAKSGTTSMAYYLAQHPEIFISARKEPFFFIKDAGMNNINEYYSLFKNSKKAKAIGEASTGYLFEKESAQLIKEFSPTAKVIIILRNPVDMAYSYWKYMSLIGNEEKSFEEAISHNERIFRNTEKFKRSSLRWWASYLYLERGLYYNQVRNYLEVFGRENVKIYIFEEFFSNLSYFCQDIFAFLGVNRGFSPDFKKLNEGGEIRFKFLHKIRNRRYPLLKKFLPVAIRVKIQTTLLNLNIKKGKKESMQAETRSYLEEFYKDDIVNLEGLLGKEINFWKYKLQ